MAALINTHSLQAKMALHPASLLARSACITVFAPGLALTAAIACLAVYLRYLTGLTALSPMIPAIVFGMVLRNIGAVPAMVQPGAQFAMRRLLRLAIILLGLQLTLHQVGEVGLSGVAIIAATLVSTFAFTVWLGRVVGVERGLAQLIAAGTSICGASAVIAANTVTRASDEDVAYAIACVTIFGSLAMLSYPLVGSLAHLDAHAFGLWSGASIHEIAQVVATSFQQGQVAGEFGTVSKLTRVMMLAPVIMTLGFAATRAARRTGDVALQGRAPMPWFVIGFIALVCLNSVIVVPVAVKSDVVLATSFLLTMSLAAMGLETDFSRLRAKGLRPLLLGFAAFLFIAGFSLLWVKVIF